MLPNLSPFDVRAQVVHGQPVTAAYLALSAGYGVLYIAAMIAGGHRRVLATRFQVAVHAVSIPHRRPRRPRCRPDGGAASLQAVRETRFPTPQAAEDALYLTSGKTVQRLSARLLGARSRPLLDSRDPVLRRRQASPAATPAAGTGSTRVAVRLRPSVPHARFDDDAGSPLQHCVPVWRDFSRGALPGWRRTTRSGHQAP